MDQPGEVANLSRVRLIRKKFEKFPFPVRAYEFGLARRVRLSRPTSACSFSTLSLNLVLTRGIPPDFRRGVHSSIPPYAVGPVTSLLVIMQSRTDGVYCLESAGTKPVVLKVVPVTGAAFFTVNGAPFSYRNRTPHLYEIFLLRFVMWLLRAYNGSWYRQQQEGRCCGLIWAPQEGLSVCFFSCVKTHDT